MNCPTRDQDQDGLGHNQNPPPLDNDLVPKSALTSAAHTGRSRTQSGLLKDPTDYGDDGGGPDSEPEDVSFASGGASGPTLKSASSGTTKITTETPRSTLSSSNSAPSATSHPRLDSSSSTPLSGIADPSNRHPTVPGSNPGLYSQVLHAATHAVSESGQLHRRHSRGQHSLFEDIPLELASQFAEPTELEFADSATDRPAMTRRSTSGHSTARYDAVAEDDVMDDTAALIGADPGQPTASRSSSSSSSRPGSLREKIDYLLTSSREVAVKYAKFVGPGIMVSVAYLDPGNYSTAVSAGALYQYKHLFVILLSNIFAVVLQILCAKLGSVTGLDLAQNCRKHLPRPLAIAIYVLAEIAIIATDLAEVVGTAIALNILLSIPLPLGVILTIADVLLVLMAYRPNGPMNVVRYFEYLVSILVVVVVVCFAVELANIGPIGAGTILEGFLPSRELVESRGLYLSCGILGATVMPHSLYLGSGLVQPRLREFDTKHGYFDDSNISSDSLPDTDEDYYKPTIHAIRYALNFSIAELIVSLFTVAIFVNSAILIVAAATLSHSPDAADADLFSIYDMLREYLGPAAATIFALALLFSGQSAGIVCTLAGQMVSEGFLKWSFQPWVRRLITRALAVAPCLFVATFVGRKGLADVLNASQVVLSLLLPFVSAPLLYFTANKKIMSVASTEETGDAGYSQISTGSSDEPATTYVDLSNSTATNIAAGFIFVFVSGLNVFLIISMLTGADA